MSRRRLLKTLLIIVPLVSLIVAGVLVAKAANSPSEGVVQASKSLPAKQDSESVLTVRGKTASFQYLSVLHQTKADALSAGDVEKFSFVNPAVPPWDLDIQVRKLPSGQLADDGSYNLRLHHPEQYTEQKTTINGALIPIMSDKTAGFGKVAFLTHGGLVAEIAMTSSGTSQTDQIQASLLKVLQTWHWL